ncbi:MAG: hypothetical protein Q9219_006970 [cf. Caloplaca sp. 3 TL-2023]
MNPPRHSVVYTVAHNEGFFLIFHNFTMRLCRRGQQYPAFLSFWSSITSEAISLMLNQSRLGKLELQKQNQGDVLRRIMPYLAEALDMYHVKGLRVGCYMILIVLSSKSKLSDELLAAIMDMVVYRWDGLTRAGLICLAVLSQQKQLSKLPKKTFKALVAMENLVNDLSILKTKYNVEKLVLSLILGVLKRLGKAGDAKRLCFVRKLMEANLMQPSLVASALKSMLCLSQGTTSLRQPKNDFDTPSALRDLIICLAESEFVHPVIRTAVAHLDSGSRQPILDILRSTSPSEDEPKSPELAVERQEADDFSVTRGFEDLARRIPAQTAFEISLLTHSESYILRSLMDTFEAACRSRKHLDAFSELSVLRKSLALTEPLYISFLIRVWCGYCPTPVRVCAISLLSDYITNEKPTADVQVLLPYILYALADKSFPVRRAAADLVLALSSYYSTVDGQSGGRSTLPVLGKGQIYGQGKQSEAIIWLPLKSVMSLIRDWLVPHLEEFQLDADQIIRSVANGFRVSTEKGDADNSSPHFKKSFRSSILVYLCSHIVNTPLYAVKSRLLPMLTGTLEVGQVATATLLIPMLAALINQGQILLETACKKEHIDVSQFIDRMMEIIRPDDQEGVTLLQTCINNSKARTDSLILSAVFRRLGHIWSLLRPQTQITLGRNLIELAMSDAASPEANLKQKEAIGILHTVKLSTGVLQDFLQDCPRLSGDGFERAAKRQRIMSPPKNFGEDIRRISFVLELVESSKTEVSLPLLGGLFQILAELREYRKQSGIELNYLGLLTMSCLRGILESSTDLQLERNHIRADVLVDSIRYSSDPQLQQTALLLVSTLANVAPELILHDVMPIFTFMGPSIMKRTDDYSTMESIIPKIIDSLRKRHKDPMAGVSDLLLSFVGAFEHIPQDRRMTLFRCLMDMIGADEFLSALLILFHNKLPYSKGITQFSIHLLDGYEVETQYQTIDRYVSTVKDLLDPKPTFSMHLVERTLLKTPEALAMDLLSHLVSLLRDKHLVTKMLQVFKHDKPRSESSRLDISRVTNRVLSLSQRLTSRQNGNRLCQELLAVILGGLPVEEFVSIIQGLLDQTNIEVSESTLICAFGTNILQTCFDTLTICELRLQDNNSMPANTYEACLNLIPKLHVLLQEIADEPVKRMALTCVDHIIERFGKKNTDPVVHFTTILVGAGCLGAASEEIRITSLLCLSTVVGVLKDEFVPFVPKTLQKGLDILGSRLADGDCSARLHDAAYSFFNALLLHIPWAATGPDLDLLIKVSHGSANSHLEEGCNILRRAALGLVAKQTEPYECCGTLERTWANAIAEGPEALKEQLTIMEDLLGRLSRSAIGRHAEAFARLLTKAFDFRCTQFVSRTEDSYEDEEVEEVEDTANTAVITLVAKVNDTIFRPMFTQLMHWAVDSSALAQVHRLTSIYKFVTLFFKRFKSIVTSYAALIVENVIEVLKRPYAMDTVSSNLRQNVFRALQECFKHDQDGFWQTPMHFNAISQVLLNQLKPAAEASSVDEIISSITLLAVAADSATHHKNLNTTILGYMRSDNSVVRLAAVQCQQSLTARLGEEWLTLLPEMLPFISELQEDDDESVERETLKWVKNIEDTLGESLTPMLQ